MNEITMKMQADELIMMALREDITSEDVSTNTVIDVYKRQVLIGLTVGLVFGVFNGVCIAYLTVPAFVGTLGAMKMCIRDR